MPDVHDPFPGRVSDSPHLTLCRLATTAAVTQKRVPMLALMTTAIPSLTMNECLGGLAASGFDFSLFSRYDDWFDNNSSMTLAQTGTYTGRDDIEEYVR